MKINIGEYELHDSGSVITIQNKPIEFFFPNFSVRVEFEDTEDKKDIQMNFSLEENNKVLVARLKNFNNYLGTENNEPVNVGRLNNRELLFQFRVYGMESADNKVFHYTWLLGKVVQDG